MVGSSKILTVSYGTFSCTLEGFEQPFETMKSIAEYFRDLAADDRYFGAEPPQPDMQMLHSIAEREARRRVETSVDRNGVRLRQTAEALTSEPSPRSGQADDDRRPHQPAAGPEALPPLEVDIDGDSVAAKLSRIRAVVARARANRSADTAFVEDEPVERYVTPAPDLTPTTGLVVTGEEDDTGFGVELARSDDSEPPVSLAAMMAEATPDAPVGARPAHHPDAARAAAEADAASAAPLLAAEAEAPSDSPVDADAPVRAAEDVALFLDTDPSTGQAEPQTGADVDAPGDEAERIEIEAEDERVAAELAGQAEAERVAAELSAQAEAERVAEELAAQAEAERVAEQLAAQAEAERVAEQLAAQAEAERVAEELAARAEAERVAEELAARAEAERVAEELAARAEAERVAAELAAQAEVERVAAELAARAEAERVAEELAAQAEAERVAAELAARVEAQRVAEELAAQAEAERVAAELSARAEAERVLAALAEEERRLDAEKAAARERARREVEKAHLRAQAALDAERAARAQASREARQAEQAQAAILAEQAAVAMAVAVPQAPIARVIKLKRTEFEAALAAGEIEEVEDGEDLDDDEMVAEIEVDADDTPAPLLHDGDEAAPEPVGDIPSRTAQVVGDDTLAALFDRDDIAEASAEDTRDNVFAETGDDRQDTAEADRDDAEAALDDTLAEGIRDLIGQTSLEADDAADLAAELAEVEREAAAAAKAAEAESARLRARYADLMDGDDPAPEDAAPPEGPAENGDERALNRLLDETNAKLSDTEGTRRRSAIAHLKAAVAATKADLLLKGNRKDAAVDESLNRYRDDLAQVVRPRRPVAGQGASADATPRERPADPLAARPAPLVLVSAQRVDMPAEGPAGAVRPRRVAGTRGGPVPVPGPDAPAGAPDGAAAISFSDFARSRGASSLPDVLEAAVAYAAEVEGQTELSRPQILRKAASLNPDLMTTREKGLQSFGQLLRSGRIRKVGLGQFALSDAVGRPQSRAAGQ